MRAVSVYVAPFETLEKIYSEGKLCTKASAETPSTTSKQFSFNGKEDCVAVLSRKENDLKVEKCASVQARRDPSPEVAEPICNYFIVTRGCGKCPKNSSV